MEGLTLLAPLISDDRDRDVEVRHSMHRSASVAGALASPAAV